MVAIEMPIVSPPSAPTNASANLVSVETEGNAKVVQWVLCSLSPVIEISKSGCNLLTRSTTMIDNMGKNGKCTDWNLNFRVINCLNNITLRLCYCYCRSKRLHCFQFAFFIFLLQQDTIPVLLTTVDVITFVRTMVGESLAVVTKALNSIQIWETVWVSKQKELLIYYFPVSKASLKTAIFALVVCSSFWMNLDCNRINSINRSISKKRPPRISAHPVSRKSK